MTFDDVLDDLQKAVVTKKEVSCYKQKANGRTRWVIDIDDPEAEATFEEQIQRFFKGVKNRLGGTEHV
jgi:hypothetical protein